MGPNDDIEDTFLCVETILRESGSCHNDGYNSLTSYMVEGHRKRTGGGAM